MQEFFSKLTWVEYLAAIAVLRGCYVGYKSGIFPEILRIASYVVTAIAAFRLKGPVGEYLTLHTFLNASTAEAAALAFLVVVVLGLLKLVQIVLLRMLKVGDGGFLNKVIGILLGAGRWTLLLSLLFMAIEHSPLQTLKTDIKTRSVAGPPISEIAPQLFGFLSTISPELGMSAPAADQAAKKG